MKKLILFFLLVIPFLAKAQDPKPASPKQIADQWYRSVVSGDTTYYLLDTKTNLWRRFVSYQESILPFTNNFKLLGDTVDLADTLLKKHLVIAPNDSLHPALTLISLKAQPALTVKNSEISDGRAAINYVSTKNNQSFEVGVNPAGQNKSFGIRRTNGVALPDVDYLWYVEPFTDTSVFPHQVRFTGLRTYTAGDSGAYFHNGHLEVGPVPGGGGGGAYLPLTFSGDNTVNIGDNQLEMHAHDASGNNTEYLQTALQSEIMAKDTDNNEHQIFVNPGFIELKSSLTGGASIKELDIDTGATTGFTFRDSNHIGIMGNELFPISGDPNQYIQAGNVGSLSYNMYNIDGTVTTGGGVRNITLNNNTINWIGHYPSNDVYTKFWPSGNVGIGVNGAQTDGGYSLYITNPGTLGMLSVGSLTVDASGNLNFGGALNGYAKLTSGTLSAVTTIPYSDITGGPSAATWGSITGTLSSQTDLNTALGLKAPLASPTFTGTVTIPNGGVFGTPTSMTATNVTGLPLTTGVTGVLPIANGGTNASSVTTSPTATAFAGWDANKNLSANSFLTGYTTTATAAGTTTLTAGSTALQYFTGSTTQTVVLPVTSTLVLGQQFTITNNATGATSIVTVQSSGGNVIFAQYPNSTVVYTVILTSGTTAASWSASYIPAVSNIGANANIIAAPSGTGIFGFYPASTVGFTAHSTSGIDVINTSGGVVSMSLLPSNSTAYIGMGSNVIQYWANGTNVVGGSGDLGITRSAAGVLEINNSSKGTFADLKLRNLTASLGGEIKITEGTGGFAGQTTLVAGTKAITVTGVTTSSRAIVTLVSQGGTVTTTVAYAAVCTANTITITALTNAGTTDTTDTSVLNYMIIN